jgi:hypothetical protein
MIGRLFNVTKPQYWHHITPAFHRIAVCHRIGSLAKSVGPTKITSLFLRERRLSLEPLETYSSAVTVAGISLPRPGLKRKLGII